MSAMNLPINREWLAEQIPGIELTDDEGLASVGGKTIVVSACYYHTVEQFIAKAKAAIAKGREVTLHKAIMEPLTPPGDCPERPTGPTTWKLKIYRRQLAPPGAEPELSLSDIADDPVKYIHLARHSAEFQSNYADLIQEPESTAEEILMTTPVFLSLPFQRQSACLTSDSYRVARNLREAMDSGQLTHRIVSVPGLSNLRELLDQLSYA